MFKLIVFVPVKHLEQVREALFAAGAGRSGNYDRCCWYTEGTGTFRPLAGSRPAIGLHGCETAVPEYRLEMLCPEDRSAVVIEALRQAHPYEEPAWELHPLSGCAPVPPAI